MLLIMRNVSDKSCRKNKNTNFMSNKFFWKVHYLWDNAESMEQPDKTHMSVQYGTCACHAG